VQFIGQLLAGEQLLNRAFLDLADLPAVGQDFAKDLHDKGWMEFRHGISRKDVVSDRLRGGLATGAADALQKSVGLG
jgi:hypothetical protein